MVDRPTLDLLLGNLRRYVSVLRELAAEPREGFLANPDKIGNAKYHFVIAIVRRKLDQIDAVTRLDDLRVPPGNRLHALTGELSGLHAVRVNDQYRIVFRFEGADAFDVRCTDYH
jgi:proteic killer suppression protein